MDWEKIINKHYPGDSKLRDILIKHSVAVARRTLLIASNHPELGLDKDFIEEAAMLHDIGILRCDAPKIYCFGTEPYIRHGIIGAEMLRSEGLMRHARVCERHTGAGITAVQIACQKLPLPLQDFLPETLEEKVVCYADKFYSKSNPDKEKTKEKVVKSLSKYGEDSVARFLEWAELFE